MPDESDSTWLAFTQLNGNNNKIELAKSVHSTTTPMIPEAIPTLGKRKITLNRKKTTESTCDVFFRLDK